MTANVLMIHRHKVRMDSVVQSYEIRELLRGAQREISLRQVDFVTPVNHAVEVGVRYGDKVHVHQRHGGPTCHERVVLWNDDKVVCLESLSDSTNELLQILPTENHVVRHEQHIVVIGGVRCRNDVLHHLHRRTLAKDVHVEKLAQFHVSALEEIQFSLGNDSVWIPWTTRRSSHIGQIGRERIEQLLIPLEDETDRHSIIVCPQLITECQMEKELVNLTREVPCHMLIMHLDHLCFLVTIFGSLLSAEIYVGGYGCGSRFSFQRLQRIHQWIGDARYRGRLQVSIGQVVSLTRVLNLVQLREPIALPGEESTFRIGDTRLVTQWLQLLARDRIVALWTYAIGWIGMIDG